MPIAYDDLAEFLNGQSGLVLGVNLVKRAIVPPVDGVLARCVFCLPDISDAPGTYLNGHPDDLSVSNVQVIVRGNPGGYEDAEALALAVRDLVQHSNPLINGGPAVYTSVDLAQSSPFPLEDDGENRPRIAFNVKMTAFVPNP